jgi:two-component system, OmpR family, copper resistance phosphate regulon response regulator CusR
MRNHGIVESSSSHNTDRRRILIIEDEKKMSDALVAGLEANGYEAVAAMTGEEGFFLAHSLRPDLLLLDLSLPQRNGLEILQQIRAEALDVRILVLTSHNSVEDRVSGLNAGADDYLGKPFSFPELLARVASLLRRNQSHAQLPLQIADLILDTNARTATRSGIRLDLTHREFDLLLYLAQNRNRPVSREMLARDVWRETSRFTPLDNVIDVQMTRLRRKVDDPFPVKLLRTVRGVGFTLREPDL